VAEQDRGMSRIGEALRAPVASLWIVLSTVVYATAALLSFPVFPGVPRLMARLWMAQLLFFCGVRVKTAGLEKLDKKDRYVFIANHSSYFDIPALYGGLPFDLSFIAKKQLFFIPLFGWGMATVGHIWLDRERPRAARASITRAVSSLKKNNISLVLFPEGTRSATGELGEFRRGSFTLAMESGVAVVPVSITGAADVLKKHSLRLKPGEVRLVIGDPVPASTVASLDKTALSALVRERIRAGLEAGAPRPSSNP
jgi:1-acyl-sn-glycerol-3-phosphate acyltransferase